MLFSELYKIMVNKVTFVGFREEIAPIALPGSATGIDRNDWTWYVVTCLQCMSRSSSAVLSVTSMISSFHPVLAKPSTHATSKQFIACFKPWLEGTFCEHFSRNQLLNASQWRFSFTWPCVLLPACSLPWRCFYYNRRVRTSYSLYPTRDAFTSR